MIKLGYEYKIPFASTVAGVGTNADSTPAVVLLRNGSASGVTVDIETTAVTGLYVAVFTTGSGWNADDILHLYGVATIAGTAGHLAVLWSSTEIGAAALDPASLAQFVTYDTGQATAVAGSVAKLSQGSASGGGDATLAKQEEILTAIQGSAVIQVASPNVSGNLVLTQGDDYDGTANPKASWTVTTDYTDGWSVALTIRDVNDAVVYTTAGTVVSSTVVAVTIAAPTGLTMTGCPGQWQGKFDVQLTKAGKKKTIALGVCYINEDQTR